MDHIMNFYEHLIQGETILWKGQPETSVKFTKADIFLVPFSIINLGGMLIIGIILLPVLIASNSANAANYMFAVFIIALFLIIDVLIGLYLMFGRFIYKRKNKEKTWYLVTNKRVIVINNLWKTKVNSANIDSIPSIQKSIRKDGIGTITFGINKKASVFIGGYKFGENYGNTGLDFFGFLNKAQPPTFFDIKDAEKVYRKVQELRAN